MRILKSIQKFEYEFDIKAERFLWKHPFLGFLSIFVGMPVFVLGCVCICTVLITFPMAWLFGWLQSLCDFKTAVQCLTLFLEKREYPVYGKGGKHYGVYGYDSWHMRSGNAAVVCLHSDERR